VGLVLAFQRSTGRLDIRVHSLVAGLQVLYTITKSAKEQSGIRYGTVTPGLGPYLCIVVVGKAPGCMLSVVCISISYQQVLFAYLLVISKCYLLMY